MLELRNRAERCDTGEMKMSEAHDFILSFFPLLGNNLVHAPTRAIGSVDVFGLAVSNLFGDAEKLRAMMTQLELRHVIPLDVKI